MLWPKLFRRLVPYLAEGADGFDGFDAWLRADPVNRDDQIVLAGRAEPARLHDVVDGRGRPCAADRLAGGLRDHAGPARLTLRPACASTRKRAEPSSVCGSPGGTCAHAPACARSSLTYRSPSST